MILDRPPLGWKRPSMPLAIKVQVLERTLRQLLGCEGIEYDHRPPLSMREFSTKDGDTVPGANNPDMIEAIPTNDHRRRTFGTKATSYGSDAHVRAKEKRIRTKKLTPEILARMSEEEFRGFLRRISPKQRAGLLGSPRPKVFMADMFKPKRKWPSRKIPSRPFRRKPKWEKKSTG